MNLSDRLRGGGTRSERHRFCGTKRGRGIVEETGEEEKWKGQCRQTGERERTTRGEARRRGREGEREGERERERTGWSRIGGGEGTGERVNGLPRPCEPPDHTGRAATTRPLQHPSSGPDSPSNRQTHSARLPDSYLTDPGPDPRHHCPSIFEPATPLLCPPLWSAVHLLLLPPPLSSFLFVSSDMQKRNGATRRRQFSSHVV